ncbi:exopolysaccharide biosynthesis protein [Psychromonas marina]|uniref:Exopolysaccharide biosynthesis protein n=1 Tax=Psychromonas marina TaxID=88364 RepID=A0ABQ6E1H0_9GAMM|nr:Rcs stress response system protein RcsF [Psychromonas marina]GLS91003.1 exopolysaccharide biosynthesis protein [Psychromonas marina]
MLLILRLTALIPALLLAGCSNYQFSSNLDKDNFEEYFKPSQVIVYSKTDLPDLDYQLIGVVEGSSCQEESNQLPADIKEARTKARVNAANMNANGIVFQSCLTFKADKTCLSNVICYGQALDVDITDNE